jgi:predicted DsbA family dithiol-disulfide isomerase
MREGKMQVEIWSDVVCPWCYIGKRRFEKALQQFEHADEVQITWRSFELDPSAPRQREGTSAQHLAKKYGLSSAEVQAMQARVTGVAAQEGLTYRLEKTVGGNTFDAHRLLHFAASRGKQGELKEDLMRAYFTEGLAIGDRGVLADLAVRVGLDRAEAAGVLAGEDFADEVRSDERDAQRLGLSGVPAFVIDRRIGVVGAEAPETLLNALRQAWAAGQDEASTAKDS